MSALALQNNDYSDLEKFISLTHFDCRGLISICQLTGDGNWYQKLLPAERAISFVNSQAKNNNNKYISVNEFKDSRKENSITQLRSLFVDIDVKHNDKKPKALTDCEEFFLPEDDDVEESEDNILTNFEANLLISRINDALASINCPSPTLIINTGRGLQLYWSFNPVPKKFLTSYKEAQQVIYQALKHLGADSNAMDASRVLRIPNTINLKSNTLAAIVGGSEYIYDYSDLLEELSIDPSAQNQFQSVYTRNGKPYVAKQAKAAYNATVANLTLKKATTNSKNNTHSKSVNRTQALQDTRLSDLIKLLENKYNGVAPSGKRELFLFMFATTLANTHKLSALREAVKEINNKYIHTTEEDCDSKLATLYNLVEAGKNYRYKSDKIIELLDIDESDMIEYNLRTLITKELRYSRNNDRRAKNERVEIDSRNNITAIVEATGWDRRTVKKRLQQGFNFESYLPKKTVDL